MTNGLTFFYIRYFDDILGLPRSVYVKACYARSKGPMINLKT